LLPKAQINKSIADEEQNKGKKVMEQSGPVIKLTFRQKAFLSKIIDVYREMQEPIHYSAVAERMGLSNSTAYDMLRLLEQKGMVSCMYATPKMTKGPGRSIILFVPTAQANDLFAHLASGFDDKTEWEGLKTYVISRLRKGEAHEYNDVLHQLLARIPEARSPRVRCAEIMTAFLITLRQTKYDFSRQSLLNKLLQTRGNRPTMNLLAGLTLGLCLTSRIEHRHLSSFQEHINEYETSLQQLSQEKLTQLHQFTKDIWRTLRKEQVA
jgi:ribosomal protein S25